MVSISRNSVKLRSKTKHLAGRKAGLKDAGFAFSGSNYEFVVQFTSITGSQTAGAIKAEPLHFTSGL